MGLYINPFSRQGARRPIKYIAVGGKGEKNWKAVLRENRYEKLEVTHQQFLSDVYMYIFYIHTLKHS